MSTILIPSQSISALSSTGAILSKAKAIAQAPGTSAEGEGRCPPQRGMRHQALRFLRLHYFELTQFDNVECDAEAAAAA
jgi:hypothetical protein